ncbi:MAG: hypothetical protein NC114_11810 [Ruminococcus flavefaciens]|nr:hypothetical protein [Ruminococcus flavefaciens]
MKTLFRGALAIAVAAMFCVAVFSSCTTDEKYDFSFELPGRIVTQLDATVVIPFTARNITSVSVTSKPSGWTVEDVDLLNWTLTVKAPSSYTADDDTVVENGDLTLTGYTAAGTSVKATSYLSLLNQTIDLTAEYSNCYVVSQMDTRYTIDVTHKGESSQTISPADVAVLWQSDRDLIDYCSFEASEGTFTFFVSHEDVTDDNGKVTGSRVPDGNAVIVAYDADGSILWSWHVWVTGSDPEVNAVATSAGVFMDRNLGAYHNSDGSAVADDIFRSYGLYYQWGRKDPFIRPVDYNFSSNSDRTVYSNRNTVKRFAYVDAEDDAEAGTLEYAVANPMSFVLGSKDNGYDWLYASHDDDLWETEEKSVYDPCPRGWRVPDGAAFEAFDIDGSEDAAQLADIRGMYGWHIVDKSTGAKLFMPGAGRRSFENGVLTNVNNYGYEHTPMPWVGYYWTAGVGTSDKGSAKSMFFDLNTTRAVNNRYEAGKEMYRANGMQVRCVRDNR